MQIHCPFPVKPAPLLLNSLPLGQQPVNFAVYSNEIDSMQKLHHHLLFLQHQQELLQAPAFVLYPVPVPQITGVVKQNVNEKALKLGCETPVPQGLPSFILKPSKAKDEVLEPVVSDNCEADGVEDRLRGKRFVCTWKDCGKVLGTRYSLQKHLRLHGDIRPFTCNFSGCQKRFHESNTLKRHFRIHTGERPFKCCFAGCIKAFADNSNYHRHLQSHTGAKPFKCPDGDCGKHRGFSRAHSLRKHLITVHRYDAEHAFSVTRSQRKAHCDKG